MRLTKTEAYILINNNVEIIKALSGPRDYRDTNVGIAGPDLITVGEYIGVITAILERVKSIRENSDIEVE